MDRNERHFDIAGREKNISSTNFCGVVAHPLARPDLAVAINDPASDTRSTLANLSREASMDWDDLGGSPPIPGDDRQCHVQLSVCRT